MKKLTLLIVISFSFFSIYANNLVTTLVLHYETDIFVLNKKQENILNEKLSKLDSEKQLYYFEISGHTDNEGSKTYNEQLSLKRASEIKNYLQDKDFREEHVYLAAFDYSKPISSNKIEEGKSLNRRVEIKVFTSNSELSKIGNHSLEKQQITIDCSKENKVTFKNGATIDIPANVFTNSKGEIVIGNVEIEYTPFNNYKDFILTDIPMSSLNGTTDYFSSGGMFELEAFKENEKLTIKENNTLAVQIPATSNEKLTDLFVFDKELNAWQTVMQGMQKEQKIITYIDTVLDPQYALKEQCSGFTFNYYNNYDLNNLDNFIAYFKNNSLNNEVAVKEAKLKLEIDKLTNINTKWINKINYYNSKPQLSIINSNDKALVELRTRENKNLSGSELKSLRNFKTYLSKEDAESIEKNGPIDSVSIVEMKKEKLTLNFYFANNLNSQYQIILEQKSSKAYYKKSLKNFEEYFYYTKESRINNLYNAKEKLTEVISLIQKTTLALNELQESKTTENELFTKNIEGVSFLLSKYKIGYQTVDDYTRDSLNKLEAEHWLMANINDDKKFMSLLSNTRKSLYCSNKSNAFDLVGYEQKIIEKRDTKLSKEVNSLVYQFKINNMGVFNVDRIMKQPDALAVTPKKYINEKNEQIPVCKLFLVGNQFNGVVRFDGAYGYTPYNFLIDANFSYGIVAVDIYGNSYKIEEDNFMQQISNNKTECNLVVNTIKETEELSLFAQN